MCGGGGEGRPLPSFLKHWCEGTKVCQGQWAAGVDWDCTSRAGDTLHLGYCWVWKSTDGLEPPTPASITTPSQTGLPEAVAVALLLPFKSRARFSLGRLSTRSMQRTGQEPCQLKRSTSGSRSCGRPKLTWSVASVLGIAEVQIQKIPNFRSCFCL